MQTTTQTTTSGPLSPTKLPTHHDHSEKKLEEPHSPEKKPKPVLTKYDVEQTLKQLGIRVIGRVLIYYPF